jgi:hypothetical protein
MRPSAPRLRRAGIADFGIKVQRKNKIRSDEFGVRRSEKGKKVVGRKQKAEGRREKAVNPVRNSSGALFLTG